MSALSKYYDELMVYLEEASQESVNQREELREFYGEPKELTEHTEYWQGRINAFQEIAKAFQL